MPAGPVKKTFGAFTVDDDGKQGHLYGVWVDWTSQINNTSGKQLIGSGMTYNHAVMVAEALYKTNAGCGTTTLTESTSKYI